MLFLKIFDVVFLIIKMDPWFIVYENIDTKFGELHTQDLNVMWQHKPIFSPAKCGKTPAKYK